ncbi:MAG: spore maturation protein [Ignavibacterium album]|uniref:nucleoside recognition domain-containing protein n=1 Tax=Ignavibacterium album TaxID=591197 RepID=UPI0026EBAA7F|nr:spore maturation protein [Ignavibacterium album]MBI5661405.1 spore maturation protein [Ignavibacterium album]
MLNYVWLALILLGFASAVYLDVSDITSNKFRNNGQLNCTVEYSESFKNQKTTDAKIIVSKKSFGEFYNQSIENDLVIPATLTKTNQDNLYQAFIKIDNSAPELLKEIAASSGKEDDIIGQIKFYSTLDSSKYSAKITLESVSFVYLKKVTNEAIKIAGTAVEIALGLIGLMAMWLGVMKVAEDAGLIKIIANFIKPVTRRIFPEIPPDHPAIGSMVMNISANMLGLGNAATPFGLKAMEELDTLNPNKGTATNSMITFLAINTAGLTLIPATAIAVRAAAGSSDPTIIIGTTMFAAFCSTLTGLTMAKLFHLISSGKEKFLETVKRNLKKILFIILVILSVIVLSSSGALKFLSFIFNEMTFNLFKRTIEIISVIAIPVIIVSFIGFGAYKKVKVYEQFVEGAKEGFNIAVRIIPYLVAMLVAIAIFRAGGAMNNWLVPILKIVTDPLGMPAEALPMALMRPLSGSGSLGIMAEIMKVHGPDSFIGILVSTFFGSTETTFYVLAVYFGAVNIKNTRYALPVGLIADVAGILAALFIVTLLYG